MKKLIHKPAIKIGLGAAASLAIGLTAGCSAAAPSSNDASTRASAPTTTTTAARVPLDRPMIAAKDSKPGNGIWAVPEQLKPGVYLATAKPGELMGAVYLCKSIVDCDLKDGGTIVLANEPQHFSIPIGFGGVMTMDVRLTPVAGQ